MTDTPRSTTPADVPTSSAVSPAAASTPVPSAPSADSAGSVPVPSAPPIPATAVPEIGRAHV